MGREVKRVALDFDYPLDTVWQGYLNPHYDHCHDCPDCRGTGWSEYAKHLENMWYGHDRFIPEENGSESFKPDHPAIRVFAERQVKRNPEFYGTGEYAIQKEAYRLCHIYNGQWCHHLNQDDVNALCQGNGLLDFTHRLLPGMDLSEFIRTRAYYLWLENGAVEGADYWVQAEKQYNDPNWLPYNTGFIPTAEQVNAWSISGFGHNSSWYICVKNRCEKAGLSHECSTCKGEGSYWDSPEYKEIAENWEQIEPPEGEGWQMWTTTTEGSPISAVCASPESLARWLVDNNVSSFGYQTESYETWLTMIKGSGWACSAVMRDGEIISGVQATAEVCSEN